MSILQQFGLYVFCGLLLIGFVMVPFILGIYTVLTKARLFFLPQGRIKRLTYWEGLCTWVLINALILMAIIAGPVYAETNNALNKFLDDPTYSIYANVFFIFVIFYWIFALWTLVAICAKRWHDLNSPGWLACLNAVPVIVIGWGVLAFLSGLGSMLYYRFAFDPNALGQGYNFFSLYSNMASNYYANYIGPNLVYVCYALAVTVGVFLYLGLFKGTPGGNAFGKVVA